MPTEVFKEIIEFQMEEASYRELVEDYHADDNPQIKALAKEKAKEKEKTCPKCSNPMFLDEDEGIVYCPKCNFETVIL